MNELILLEWKKFKSNTVFRVLAAMYLLLAPFIILMGRDIVDKMQLPMLTSAEIYEFPKVWDYQGYIGNWLVPFCLGFLTIYIITSEVGNKTMRQNILTGLTKKSFFISKLLSILIMALGATFIYAVSTIAIGIINTDGIDLELVMDNNFAIIKFFLLCLGYMTFALLVAFTIRRGTLAIFFYFFYFILEAIFQGIHVYYYTHVSRNYWPINSIEDLHPFPLLRLPDFFTDKEWNFSILLPDSHAVLMSLVYISLFVAISYRSFMKRDI